MQSDIDISFDPDIPMRITSLSSVLACLLLLGACASQTGVDWKAGNRPAWIVSFYGDDTAPSGLPGCLASLPSAELHNRRFAKLYYRHVRRMMTEVVEIPDGIDAHVDDLIEILPQDCDQGKLSQFIRVIPRFPR
jgi:hypothetical protein